VDNQLTTIVVHSHHFSTVEHRVRQRWLVWPRCHVWRCH